MDIYKKQSLSETFKVYFDKRMVKILLAWCDKWFSLGNNW